MHKTPFQSGLGFGFGYPISITVLSENGVEKVIEVYLMTSSTELLNCLHLMASVLFRFCWLGYNDFIKRTAVSSRTSGLAFPLFSDAYVTWFAQCIAGTRCFGMRRTKHLESRRKDVSGNLLWNSNLYKSVVFSWNWSIDPSFSYPIVMTDPVSLVSYAASPVRLSV